MQRQHRKAFTLIEVLIVVTILGILAATVLPQFSASSAEAQQATLMHNLQILRGQIAMYKSQHGSYPAQTATVSQDFKNALLLATDAKGNSGGTGLKPFGPYIVGQLPNNPFTNGKGVKMVNAPISSTTPDETAMDGTDNVGWIYSPTEGLLKANNVGLASDGVTPLINL